MMLALLMACFSSGGGDDCSSIDDGVQREECFFQEAVQLSGDRSSLENYIFGIEEASSQDLLRIRLAVRDPVRNQWLCDGVTTQNALERCRQVVGRPHLRGGREGELR